MKSSWQPGFFESLKVKDPTNTERRLDTASTAELFRYARYHRAAGWLLEREQKLGNLWNEMCAEVLPKLRTKPFTNQTVRNLGEYSHGMVNRRPIARYHNLPEDWRINFWLGKYVLPTTGENISNAAVVSFSAEVQQKQRKKLQHFNGVMNDGVAKEKLHGFRNDLQPDKVRSIWVGRLERVIDKSWKKGHIKVRNPFMWPQELMSEEAFARLGQELEADPKASNDPFVYLEEMYGTPRAIEKQGESMQLLGRWATLNFTGYLSSENPPVILGGGNSINLQIP